MVGMILTLPYHSCYFLDRIPLELRFQIYSCSITPRAVFNIGYAQTNVDREKDQAVFRNSGMSWESNVVNPACLSYKLSNFTPLLLVCKQVSYEVQSLLRTSPAPNHWLSGIKPSTKAPEDQRAIIESAAFEELWERSRFELTIGPSMAMDLITCFPRTFRNRVRSLVFGPRSLNLFRAANKSLFGWRKNHTGHSDCAQFLRGQLLGIREIAIWVPVPWYFPMAHYPDSAPLEMVDLLRDGTVDVVRFLYADSEPSILTSCKWLRRVHFSDNPEASSEGPRETKRQLVATIEELLDADTGKPLKQTAETPFNVYPGANMVVALRRTPGRP